MAAQTITEVAIGSFESFWRSCRRRTLPSAQENTATSARVHKKVMVFAFQSNGEYSFCLLLAVWLQRLCTPGRYRKAEKALRKIEFQCLHSTAPSEGLSPVNRWRRNCSSCRHLQKVKPIRRTDFEAHRGQGKGANQNRHEVLSEGNTRAKDFQETSRKAWCTA